MGRTARAGKPGEYRMIPNMVDGDVPLNKNSYNIYNEVDKYQKQKAVQSIFQEDVTKVYALFLEDVTQKFLASRPEVSEVENWLVRWQDFLNNIQKNWETKMKYYSRL